MSNRTIRYAEYESEGTCVVLEWGGSPSDFDCRPTRRAYRLDKRPKWLVTAVAVGKLGGYARHAADSTTPPRFAPTVVLWFIATPPSRREIVEYRNVEG